MPLHHNSSAFSPLASQCAILVPRAHDPSGLWQGSRALAGPDFLSMRRAFVSCSRPIRFDEKSVNRGLPVLDQARALEPFHRPEGSWALGTRMRNVRRFVSGMRRNQNFEKVTYVFRLYDFWHFFLAFPFSPFLFFLLLWLTFYWACLRLKNS